MNQVSRSGPSGFGIFSRRGGGANLKPPPPQTIDLLFIQVKLFKREIRMVTLFIHRT